MATIIDKDKISEALANALQTAAKNGSTSFGTTLAKYLGVGIICAGVALFGARRFTHYFDVPIVQVQTVTEQAVIDNSKFATSNESTRAVIKEIEKIKKGGKTVPAAVLPSTAKTNEVQSTINSLRPDIALSEPSDTHTGYNIYSIKINKTQHALGIYVGANVDRGSRDTSAWGVHYRNKKLAYEVGQTFSGEMEVRVVWEAIQW